jgi:Transglycosylase SLT domain
VSAPPDRPSLSVVAVAVPLVALFALICGAVCIALAFGGASGCGTASAAPGNVKGVPARLIPIYQQAAAKYRLGPKGPAILAGINWEETGFGTNLDVSSAEAEGWMQFLPSSWEAFGVDGNGDGIKDPYNPWDAIFAAANLLSYSGAPGNWHDAIHSYNHAEWYVEDVLAAAAKYSAGTAAAAPEAACTGATGGSAELQRAQTLLAPRAFKRLPERFWVGEGAPEAVDARIWPDAVWLLETYDLMVTAARESGHQTHGDGTAMDMIPAADHDWEETAKQAATDLGWIESCGLFGVAPSCSLVPAIQFIGYNGYPGHGDPAHAGENAHLHVSWKSSEYGCPGLCEPREWVVAFPLSAFRR